MAFIPMYVTFTMFKFDCNDAIHFGYFFCTFDLKKFKIFILKFDFETLCN